MSLLPPDTAREPVHARSIRVQSFVRDDGLWDLETELLDVKSHDFQTRRGIHRAGEPVHQMQLRVTIDDSYTIVAAQAAYDHAPYGVCAAIAPRYGDLVGLNLLRGFRHAVKARFGHTAGCTHLSELSWVLPTVAIQSRAGQRAQAQAASGQRPFQLGGCHALALSGAVVKAQYPQWFVASDTGVPTEADATTAFSFSHPTGQQ